MLGVCGGKEGAVDKAWVQWSAHLSALGIAEFCV